MKTDEELKQWARDYVADKIFTSDHIRAEDMGHMLPLIFMVLALMTPEEASGFAKEDIGVLYEYYSEAAPRGVNGYPCFLSVRVLTKSETEEVNGYVKALRAAMDAAL